MQALVTKVAEYYGTLSGIELAAVALAIAYLLLAIRQNIWCWLCAALSTAIYVYVFAGAKLYMESLLNVFYFAMAVYGWLVWRSGGKGTDTLPVRVWPVKIHAAAIGTVLALAALSGFLLSTYTDAAYPYVDSATTFAAVWATFLVARKVLENWWYWLVIDAVSVLIYWSRGLEPTAVLFVVYLAMIPFGLIAWTNSYRRESDSMAAA